jgi:hypothetical protein
MKRLALLTTIAMALPVAAAYADPPVRVIVRDDARQTRDHDRDRGAIVVFKRDRYDRFERSRWARDYRDRWTSMGVYPAHTPIQTIHLDGRRYGKLRIEGLKGAPVIQRMEITFANGGTQMVDLNMRLSRGVGEVIDLEGTRDRRISQIMVYSAPRASGAFAVYGA